jgi:uncharacterized protein (DUF2147 family)
MIIKTVWAKDHVPRCPLRMLLVHKPVKFGRRFFWVIIGLFGLWATPSLAAEPSVTGLWQKTVDGKPAVWVIVAERNGVFEGAFAKLFPKPGENPNPICSECADDRKNAPWLGMSFIRGMKRQGLNYVGGTVLDPRSGDIYNATLKVSEDGQKLTLRGYLLVPMLGKDDVWERLPDSALAYVDRSVIAKYMPGSTTTGSAKSKGNPAVPK